MLTVENGVMADHSADHITTEESAKLIADVRAKFGRDGVQFYPGVSYRHLTIVAGEEYGKTACTPPHDILGQPVDRYLPSGPGSEVLRRVMQESTSLLEGHPVNQQRVRQGKRPANMLWFWGQGTAVEFPPFREAYGLKAACISAVDIVRGIGRLAEMEILQVPGITGYFDTNYAGKAQYALKALDDGYDFILIHVESTDEAGHMGDANKKIQAIEDVDQRLVKDLLEGLKTRGQPFAVLVTPDHPTSVEKRTHISDPVPFAVYATGGAKDAVSSYNETAVRGSSLRFEQGFELMRYFIGTDSVIR